MLILPLVIFGGFLPPLTKDGGAKADKDETALMLSYSRFWR
jgi:hypothetical protein